MTLFTRTIERWAMPPHKCASRDLFLLALLGLCGLLFLSLKFDAELGIVVIALSLLTILVLLAGYFRLLASAQQDVQSERATKVKMLLLFAGIALSLPLIGIVVIQYCSSDIEQQSFEKLDVMIDLKQEEIDDWFKTREQEANALHVSAVFAASIRGAIQNRELISKQALDDFISVANPLIDLSLMTLLAADLTPLSSPHQGFPIEPMLSEIHAAQHSGDVVLYHANDDSTGRLRQSWIVPIPISNKEQTQERLPSYAILLIHQQLEAELYGLTQNEVFDHESRELLLLHQNGDQLAYLSPRRFQPEVSVSGLRLTEPLEDLASMGPGHEVHTHKRELDYRGVSVLAVYRALNAQGWYLLAKVDEREAIEPFRTLVLLIICTVLVIQFVIVLMIFRLWGQSLLVQQRVILAKQSAQERLLNKLYDLPYVGMAIASIETKCLTHCNDRLCEILGYQCDELKTIDWPSLTHPDDLLADVIQFERLLNGEIDSYSIEKRIFRKDGSLAYVMVDIKGVRREDGTLESLLTILIDTTGRTLLEQTLRQREYEYRQLFEANPLPMWVCDTQTKRFLAANNAALANYGYTREAFLIMGLEHLTFRGDAADTDPHDPEGVLQHRLQSGAIIDVQVFSYPLAFEGRPAEVVVAMDITQQRRDAQGLQLAATVLKNTREGVLITDLNTRIIQVNPSVCQMFGYREDELIGQYPALFRSDQHPASFFDELWKRLNNQSYWQGELWCKRKNGEVFPVHGSICAVYDESHKLSHYVAITTDISHLKESERQLEFLANHDALTQLPNRRLFSSQLQQSLENAQGTNKQLGLLILDLDRFKNINDSFGHLAGDELLQHLAFRLRVQMRQSDMAARIGGDEFVVLLGELGYADEATQIAKQIVSVLSMPIKLSNGVEVRIGACVGISLYPDHGHDAEELLQHTNSALYHAKEQGRGSFSYYAEHLTHTARHRLALEARLRRACFDDELRVYFQPQVNMDDGRVIGAEALVRWLDPERGLIPPDEFIPIAESSGLIDPLGRWVIREVCRQGKEWLDSGYLPGLLSVNLSAVQLRHCDIVATVKQILTETGFPAECLVIELTESALMQDDCDVQQVLAGLREIGVSLAIDDFGTGYSSLAYLKHFEVDVLKIDKSFVNDIEFSQSDQTIVRAIIAMGKSLGLCLLAEGIETHGQMVLLTELGCDFYQGFYKSRPVPAEQYQALMDENGCFLEYRSA
jgi:diguanylate cyclase (GGDEF)-like protein/PAS domain S-box-containing protein